jgi:predicted TIM-barrel fold metal-dependent hydrolase
MKHFYDIHCHVFNLSHANLIAIIKRVFSELIRRSKKPIFSGYIILGSIALLVMSPILLILGLLHLIIPDIIKTLFRWIFKIIGVSKIMNFLSIMQNDLGNQLIIMDNDVKELIKTRNDRIEAYDKIVLTPLMMDFGYKAIDSFGKVHYNKIYSKKIVEQAVDLFNGIKKYKKEKKDGIFEIYPFLGLNTQNYPLKNEISATMDKRPDLDNLSDALKAKIKFYAPRLHFISKTSMTESERKELQSYFRKRIDKDRIQMISDKSQKPEKSITLRQLLNQHFKDFKRESMKERYAKLKKVYSGMENFNGDIQHGIGNYNYAGIKVYPPLGFNPWPTEDKKEFAKVNLLYKYCQDRNIPITTHCSKGGYRVVSNKTTNKYNSPETWDNVLKKYKNLKLNFAHFGGNLSAGKWQRKIVELVTMYPSVYVDVSYICTKYKSYGSLDKMLNKLCKSKKEEAKSKILFGTDFSVNLFEITSYKKYIEYFRDTSTFTENDKNNFCCENPQKFLFA